MSHQPSREAAQPHDEAETAETVEMVEADDGPQSAIYDPSKLMRIAIMLREMQEEVRRAGPDEAGRQKLKGIQDRALREMRGVLSEDLQSELDALLLPDETDTPTESEVRIAQAQLIGWLEGLFQGIQAAVFNQQLQARQQLEQMRQRGALPPGMRGTQSREEGHGQYL